MPRWRVRAALAGLALMVSAFAAAGQSIIRDAEIERGLRELAAPILAEAGLPRSIRIIVINDDSLNAFVADRRHIFIHSGLLMRLERPAELQAIIAHEAAHIANGHLTNRAAAAGRASAGQFLGVALAVALAGTGNSEAAVGIGAGAQSLAARGFFQHTRAEEASADQSALRYMASAGIDPQAMRDVLAIFWGQEVLSAARQDPYLRTHPLTRDRLRAVEAFVAARSSGDVEPTLEAQYWFARSVAKLQAFLGNPRQTLRTVQGRDDEIAILSRAIAYHRRADADQALSEMARLLAMRPNDPYYQELQGQILFESRRFADAARAYARAVELAPREALILASYGRALLALDTDANTRAALDVLERAYAREPGSPMLLISLARAYAETGNPGMASAMTAERYAIQGDLETAEIHANRAVGLLPNGSPGWSRAQDILRAAAARD